MFPEIQAEITSGDEQVREAFRHDFSALKAEIDLKLGAAISQINAKVTELDQSQHQLTAKGNQLLADLDKQQATYMTNLQ